MNNQERLCNMSDRIDLNRAQTGAEVDAGLQAYMRGVFTQMGAGVALTGLIAMLLGNWGVSNPLAFMGLFTGMAGWVLMLSPLAIVLVASFGFQRLSHAALQACFWAYASLIGVSFSMIAFQALIAANGGDLSLMSAVANAFFAAAAAFLGAALYGYTTNNDITRFSGLFFMAIIGIFVAMIINLFLQSTFMGYVISIFGVILFTALTAYDTQRLKMTYYEVGGTELGQKLAVMGALGLYINFVLIFQFLLSLFMSRD